MKTLALHNSSEILADVRENGWVTWPSGNKASPAKAGMSDGEYRLSGYILKDAPPVDGFKSVTEVTSMGPSGPVKEKVYTPREAPSSTDLSSHVLSLIGDELSSSQVTFLLLLRELQMTTPAMDAILVEFKSWVNTLRSTAKILFQEGKDKPTADWENDPRWPAPPVSLAALKEML